jgi:hypothetical protein
VQRAVAEQRPAKTPALQRSVNRQPTQPDNRDRIRHLAPKAADAAGHRDGALLPSAPSSRTTARISPFPTFHNGKSSEYLPDWVIRLNRSGDHYLIAN